MKAAVLGSPIGHSLSPVLHRAAYVALGLTDWCYAAIDCDEQRLPSVLTGCEGRGSDRSGSDESGSGEPSCGKRWAGLSLTMPLKRAVLPLLDQVDQLAVETGCANTVVFHEGARRGYNTDVAGMVAALTAAGLSGPGVAGSAFTPECATVLGAGATACSALAALRALGLSDVTAAVRAPSRAGELLATARRLGVRITLRPFEPGSADAVGCADPTGARTRGEGELLVSTVPVGAADAYAEHMRRGGSVPHVVFDVVYAPWPTGLAEAARQAGAAVVGGFDLLVHQAARQVELMTGRHPAPVEAMRAAGLAELDRRMAQRRAQSTTAGMASPPRTLLCLS